MSLRLDTGGRFIDRATPVRFTFNGQPHEGFAGDTLASALMGAGRLMVGRSFKYHRPRGVVASGVEEPNALFALGAGGRHEPNQRATTTDLAAGMQIRSQNHWPGLGFDIGALNARLARFLPAGFYYKTFLSPPAFWKHVYEPLIRQSAGLGRAPQAADPDGYEHFHIHVDVLIAGGGVAGIQAALLAGEAGARVLMMEQTAHWGGRAPVDSVTVAGQPAQDWLRAALARLDAMKNVTLRTRCGVVGVYDHGYVLADEQPPPPGPRHRLWKIRARQVIAATGALERPLAFPGNDVPGVLLASAVRDYVVNWAVAPGRRTVIVTNNDDAYRTAIALVEAGLEVPAILDARGQANGPLPERARALGLRVETGKGIGKVRGKTRVTGAGLCNQRGSGLVTEVIPCDAVAMSGGWSPVVHLWSHCGGKLIWDETQAHFRPDPALGPVSHDGVAFVHCAGAAAGALQAGPCQTTAGQAAGAVLKLLGCKAGAPDHATAEAEAPLAPVWVMPQRAGPALRAKMWLDFQNDVKVSDVQLAAREGYESVEHTKRYTTLGMATDQGKLSNINGLAVLAESLGAGIPQVGTTTFRPPYTPVPLGAIAGQARGKTFQPLRRTPMQDWHEAEGARFEPVGQWRRPYAYPKGESLAQAVRREVRNTRENVGLLDASTLGKLLVKGPDAGRFLDLLYTNMMSSLKVGRCRYGLMCNENGFLMEDGVVARLGEDSFLCHTTSGGAEHIHQHMEEWLQTEWWDMRVYVANLTEQYAQIAVVGPKARQLLERLGGMDVSPERVPFMGWAEGVLATIPARVFRISFSGELSFEVAVPAKRGMAFWQACLEAGADLGIAPYGTEALHVMRAEKGFIMIGDETDGTVTPQDLGLDWAVSKKKDDFIGKRGQARLHLSGPDRWRLVGLETTDGSVLPEGAYALAPGRNANGQRNVQGRVTSTYHSPTLGRGIAMGLVRRGPERMGEVLEFSSLDGPPVPARIVSPVFYDPDGEKQNV
ncbi:sarcosine oxidase subunit alpha [Rhodovulum imhoffii]|uniref:Sarcosine oxidase subunit alpha n=1 Tax=Rhodovulum imhoffii TaxID=365340 RepID=A0A2T5BPZ2_9RHOB|nr:sarcosine oxidase subunit alpha family protein [Rhodovulum imhoffii]MBK5934093.1 sarcosine oxidase subunit alpha [Rhodovulum imhoffii]PTN01162.1 sarcosine oxidase subunit alpha [Rhodovulum imhoffii]